MKLSIRFSIFVVLMLIVSFVMSTVVFKFAAPCLLSSNSEFIIVAGLIFVMITALVIWVAIADFLVKVLNCEEIIEKIIGKEENDG